MTPAAQVQAAIELLAAIHGDTASPADRVSAAFFRERRYMGGGDRRAVIDRVYAVLRRRAALDWWIERASSAPTNADRDRLRMIAGLALIDGWNADRIAGSFDGGRYHAAPLSAEERNLARALQGQAIEHPEQPEWVRLEYPEWLTPRLRETFGPRFEAEMAALMREAPLDLRANALKATREEAAVALKGEGVDAAPTPLSPWGLRVEDRLPLQSMASFRGGLIEVQDEGSQVAALMVGARPGLQVVDFCAGAGGKTLALAAAMGNKGRLIACDTLPGRLKRAGERLRRAGAHNVQTRPLTSARDAWVKRHVRRFDRVLVDAPCSGSGTWRRNPDAKWRFTPEQLAALAALQREILASACRLVKPGGRLIYVTCSLLGVENVDQVRWFLEHEGSFAALSIDRVWAETIGTAPPATGSSLFLTPAQHGCDGFFVAVLERRPAADPGATADAAATKDER
jgi:16S rRNA (cytosine967-C5)-methyltransferase